MALSLFRNNYLPQVGRTSGRRQRQRRRRHGGGTDARSGRVAVRSNSLHGGHARLQEEGTWVAVLLLLSSLSLESGVRLASILVLDFFFILRPSLGPFHSRLHSPILQSRYPFPSQSRQISLHTILPSQSWSSSSLSILPCERICSLC